MSVKTYATRLFIGGICLIATAPAFAQGVIVDHTSLALFDQIPDEYIRAAANLSMMFVDKSVGANIDDGLTCLAFESDEKAPARCRRGTHVVPEFSVSEHVIEWSRPGGYDRSKWTYYWWPGAGVSPEVPCGLQPGNWGQYLECFIRYVDAEPSRYRVYSYQNSYLEVVDGSDIASASTGYFVSQPERFDIGDFEAMEARHPQAIFLHHTTSLARSIGSQVSADFNNQMRQYARSHNKFLLDVADIESHDPNGNPCFDNRDGIPYAPGSAFENHPDDGMSIPAVCQHYTRETEGGHLGNPETGKIRLAKAFWILMARVAGWNPPGTSPPPAGFAITTSSLPNGFVGQTYSALLGAVNGIAPYSWSIASGALPGGLVLDSSSGGINGTPVAEGTSEFIVQVADAQVPPQVASQGLQLTVLPAGGLPALAITTEALPTVGRNRRYSVTLAAAGGQAPYTWSISSGRLPQDVFLNGSTGTISGEPENLGSYTFTVEVRDSQVTPAVAARTFTITVVRP